MVSPSADTVVPVELEPVALPEFGGFKVGFAMCLNRMCPNFGQHWGTEPGSDGWTDSRYEFTDNIEDGLPAKKIVCRYCGVDHPVHAARSIRPIARHFLAESLPFADCVHEDCENHGRNVFEVMGGDARGRRVRVPYTKGGPHRVRCNGRRRSTGEKCDASITLGSTPPVGQRSAEKWNDTELALHLIRLGLSQTHAEGFYLTPDFFQRSRSNFGRQFRDYHAYRNASLLKPGEHGFEDSTAVVVTDVLQVSLKRFGIGPSRTQRLNVIVSVLRLKLKKKARKKAKKKGKRKKTIWFVLAAHICYLPALWPRMLKSQTRELKEQWHGSLKDMELEELGRDIRGNGRLLRRWAALHTVLDAKDSVRIEPLKQRKSQKRKDDAEGDDDATDREKVVAISPGFADGGHHGHMVKSPYAEVAHFLVVRRMLARFKRVHFYTDASYDLTRSVMVAMHDWVSSGRAHMAVVQHKKPGGKRDTVSDDGLPPMRRKKALPRAMKRMEERFAQRVAEQMEETTDTTTGEMWGEEERVRRARVAVWGQGPQGAGSEKGKFVWLAFPPDTEAYRDCRTFWLSRGPDDTFEDGRDLLIGATLQSVDSACRSLRKRINTFQRPEKAARGVSYVSSPYRVEGAMGELRTYLLMRNYCRRPGTRWANEIIPAAVLGLSDGEEIDVADLLWSFRLGVEHAAELSEWLGR